MTSAAHGGGAGRSGTGFTGTYLTNRNQQRGFPYSCQRYLPRGAWDGTRPPELDCAFEAICETCTFFQTSIEFRPTLQRQHDHAAEHHQPHRAALFNRLLTDLD
jgi:hypothetical protein